MMTATNIVVGYFQNTGQLKPHNRYQTISKYIQVYWYGLEMEQKPVREGIKKIELTHRNDYGWSSNKQNCFNGICLTFMQKENTQVLIVRLPKSLPIDISQPEWLQ